MVENEGPGELMARLDDEDPDELMARLLAEQQETMAENATDLAAVMADADAEYAGVQQQRAEGDAEVAQFVVAADEAAAETEASTKATLAAIRAVYGEDFELADDESSLPSDVEVPEQQSSGADLPVEYRRTA